MSNIQKQHKISPAIAWLTIQKFIIFYCPLDGEHTRVYPSEVGSIFRSSPAEPLLKPGVPLGRMSIVDSILDRALCSIQHGRVLRTGVECVQDLPVEHRAVAGHDRRNDDGPLAALRPVDGHSIGQRQIVPVILIHHKLAAGYLHIDSLPYCLSVLYLHDLSHPAHLPVHDALAAEVFGKANSLLPGKELHLIVVGGVDNLVTLPEHQAHCLQLAILIVNGHPLAEDFNLAFSWRVERGLQGIVQSIYTYISLLLWA